MLRCVAWWYVYTRTNEPGDADTTWQKDEAGAANRPVTGFMLTKVNACLGDCLRTAVALIVFFFMYGLMFTQRNIVVPNTNSTTLYKS